MFQPDDDQSANTVFLVGTCEWGPVSNAIESADFHSIQVNSVEKFLDSREEIGRALCVFVHAGPSINWHSLHQKLLELGIDIPVFAVSTDEDLSKTINAAKPFANFVLSLPINEESMQRALSLAWSNRGIVELQFSIERSHRRLAGLSERERTILAMAVEGAPNKRIASQLGLHIKTIERIRQGAYDKLQVRSTAEMSRMMTLAELHEFVYWTDEEPVEASGRHIDFSAPQPVGIG